MGEEMKYTQEIKTEVERCFQDSWTISSISSKYAIPYSTVYRWKQDYLSNYKSEEKSNLYKILYLQRRIDTLQREINIWKSSKATRFSTIEEKVREAKRLAPMYGVHSVCRVLDLRRSNYYHHTLRSPAVTQIQAEDERLKPIVRKVFEETKGRIGPKKIRAIMTKDGYVISSDRIHRLLEEMNLHCINRGKKPHNTEPPKQRYYKDRLKQQFTVNAPNRVWVCDTTYLYVNYEPYFLTVIMDLFSRKVISYRIVDSISAFPAIELFSDAYEKRGKPMGLIFHSDQGAQFTAYRFKALLRGFGVLQSFSAPANPYDNAVIETFFRNLKNEQIYTNSFSSIKALRESVDEYIDFYNEVRPHQRLKYKTPNYVEMQYYETTRKEENCPVF